MSSASVRSISFLSFIEPIFAWNVPLVSLIFWKSSLVFSILYFPLFLCTDHWGRLSYLYLLFFGTLHSNGYIFPFLLGFWLLFFSQLFVRPPQAAILLFCISFSWGWSWSLSPVQCHEPPSIVHHHCSLEKYKSKLQCGIPSSQSKQISTKILQAIIPGENGGKREQSCTVSGHVNWYGHYGEQYGSSFKS